MEANWGAIVLAVLGIAGMIVGAWATRAKNESEIDKDKAKAEIKERSDLLEMIQGLTTQNKEQTKQGSDFLTSLSKIREENEQDYETLKNINDSNTSIVVEEVKKSRSLIIERIELLDTTIQAGKPNWMEIIETVAAEFASVFASKLQEQSLIQNQYPFPAVDDPDWVENYIKPIVSRVYLYNRPFVSDSTRTRTEINPEGRNTELYRGWKKDWVAVRFTHNGKVLFGWIQEHEVMIGVSAIKKVTSEVQAVNGAGAMPAASPIPAT